MLTWLLSGLGVAGIGAALFFIPGAAAKAAELAMAALSIIKRFPWQTAVFALVAVAGWQTHSLNRTRKALETCQDGRKADRASYVARTARGAAKGLGGQSGAGSRLPTQSRGCRS
jgi:hypothetical protein